MKQREILEYIPTTCQILGEGTDKKGEQTLRVLVKWQQAGKINGNKRRYRKELLEREIERLSPLMKGGEVWGSSYHPEDGVGKVSDITHSWEKVWMEPSGECFGEIEVLPTSSGKDLQVVLRKGKIGMSSRGRGTLTLTKDTLEGKEVEFDDVNDDYHMITPGDFVLGPSVDDAGPVRILESKLNKDLDSENLNKDVNMIDVKTIEDLRKVYPELLKQEVDARVAEAKAEIEADLDNKIATAIAEEKDKLKEEAEDVVLEMAAQRESEFINVLREIVGAICSIDGVISEEEQGEGENEEETDEEKETPDPQEEVVESPETIALKTKIQELETKIAVEIKAKEGEALQKTLKESLDALLKDDKTVKYSVVIREEIVKNGKVDAKDEADLKVKVDAAVERAQKTIVESKKQKIITDGLVEKGIIPNSEGSDKLDETQKKEKEAAFEKEARQAGYKGDIKSLKG